MENKETEHKKHDGYGMVLKFLGMFGGAHSVSLLLNMLRNKYAAFILGTHGLGMLAVFNRTIQAFSDSTNLSLSLSAVRKLSEVYERNDESLLLHFVKVVRSLAFFTGLVGSLLMLIASPFVGRTLGSEWYYASRLVLLSPVILFIAITGGELAILRATKQFSNVAKYTLWTSALALCITVPFYYLWPGHLGAIFPTILSIFFVQMLLILHLSTRIYKYSISPFRISVLREGMDIVKLGGGFVYTTMLVSCTIWLICNYLSDAGGEGLVGLFSSGYVLIGMLPGILFSALDSEYYPRLSACFAQTENRNRIIDEQVEVQILIQAPVLIAFVVFLPELLPMLYTNDFVMAVPMAQVAMLGMFVSTMAYPISFMPMAKGDTVTFIVQETIYNVLLFVLVVVGYINFGLVGIGYAIVVARIIDFIVVYAIARQKYGYYLSSRAVSYFLPQVLMFMLVVTSVLYIEQKLMYWLVGLICIVASASLSLYMITKHSSVLGKVVRFIRRKK